MTSVPTSANLRTLLRLLLWLLLASAFALLAQLPTQTAARAADCTLASIHR